MFQYFNSIFSLIFIGSDEQCNAKDKRERANLELCRKVRVAEQKSMLFHKKQAQAWSYLEKWSISCTLGKFECTILHSSVGKNRKGHILGLQSMLERMTLHLSIGENQRKGIFLVGSTLECSLLHSSVTT